MKSMRIGSRPAARDKAQHRKIGGRGATLAALALALGTAVYLNWSLARNAPAILDTAADLSQQEPVSEAGAVLTGAAGDASAPTQEEALPAQGGGPEDAAVTAAEPIEMGGTQAAVVFDPLAEEGSSATDGPGADKNYGEAQLVSVNKDSGTEFFDEARLARAKARDQALDDVQAALKKSGLSSEEKEALAARLAAQLGNATAESDLETLIKAKGFADCVVMLDGGQAQVTVMTEEDALTSQQVTCIRDAVLGKCPELSAQDITVIEVK